ncbi:MAG TPA: TonB-dependent receptor, partial [Pyrinomonadaceae bacterium]|nr:TonB-dependent receptor [Pyrinomonadaceae bacterium]
MSVSKIINKNLFAAAFLAAAFCLSGAAVFAQTGPTGSLTGTVTDSTGAIVQAVNVTIINNATGLNRTAQTNDDGRFVFQVLPVGAYQVSFEKQGFNKNVAENVEIEASVPRTLNQILSVGEVTSIVEVTSDTPLLVAESSANARQISGEEVTRVPTSTRSFTQLLSTEAGVSAELSPVATNGNGNQSPSVNGTRTTSTSLFFNGIDATNITNNEGSLNDNIAPAPETLQEVKLQTSLYDASTGRSGGGNFQLVTRSGGNRFNGTAYYYLQNNKLNSNEFFFKEAGVEKPQADRNEAGFTIGGPVIKDRFFFFGGYQFTTAKTGFVPTARSRTVLPKALTVLGNDRSREAIAAAFNQFNSCSGANCLTAADISPVAFSIFNLRNPVTGGFVLPSLGGINFRDLGMVDQAGTGVFTFGNAPTITTRTLQRNNQLVEVLNVQPSEFKQQQFTARLDGQLSQNNNLSGTFFYTNFPGLDSFPDPNSLASPFTLKRNDRSRVFSVSDTHILNSNLVNEARFGYFYLNNTRSLDDPFLELTNERIGVFNPATTFDNSVATRRLGHYIGRNNLANFSFGGPNDSFNRRKQVTFSISDNLSWTRGSHSIRFGGEYKRHQFDTNLPEEQATEFEKFDNFNQLLTGNATEADTQYGVTDKSFRFRDYAAYITDDWKINRRLTLNLGLRYEFFSLPTEKDGRIGNFDPTAFSSCFERTGGSLALCDNPTPGFIIPNNVRQTGNPVVDGAIAATQTVGNKHTLNGHDKNNFAPRFGAAFKISDKMVVRGGYGMFYDRPSAAFINTIFSNYPFLREVEITVPSGNVPIQTAFSNVPTTIPLNQWLPFRIFRVGNTYQIRDNTPVFSDPRGNANPVIPGSPAGTSCNTATGAGCIRGNIAETFEFRAIDRNLKTPLIQQWNVGLQYEIFRNWLVEARYVGTKGKNLLQARALNQGYDLNDPNTPDHIFERFNQAFAQSGGTLNAGATARERGVGRAFGFINAVTGQLDYNLANATGTIINFEARVPILGFNVPEALILGSDGFSDYHGAQFNLTKRFSKGLQFNVSYTFSKSIDTSSSDPGSTAGGGKPDVPNTGFIVQGDSRNPNNNKALSDFDRTHRFSTSFLYEIPSFGSQNRFLKGWQVSGFFQAQSGTPFSIFAAEPELATTAQLALPANATEEQRIQYLARGSGGLYRLGF